MVGQAFPTAWSRVGPTQQPEDQRVSATHLELFAGVGRIDQWGLLTNMRDGSVSPRRIQTEPGLCPMPSEQYP